MIGLIGPGTPLGGPSAQSNANNPDTRDTQQSQDTKTASPQSGAPAESKAPPPTSESPKANASGNASPPPPQARLAPESSIRVEMQDASREDARAEVVPAPSDGKLESMRKALEIVQALAEQPADSRITALFESKAADEAQGAKTDDTFSVQAESADDAPEMQETVDRYL